MIFFFLIFINYNLNHNKMNSYVFSSPFLKYKNNNLYLLERCDLNLTNYDEETYFIDFNEINKSKKIKINDLNLEYDILLYENDKNLLIKFNIDKKIDDLELNKVLFFIEKNISGFDQINNIYENINNDNFKNYINKYIQI